MKNVERRLMQALNNKVRGVNEAEEIDPNDYIYASLSQPPIKVIDKHNTNDEMEWDVECPNCGAVVNYGKEIFMNSGQLYCATDGCRENLLGIRRRNES